MPDKCPPELDRLLESTDSAAREEAWTAFLDSHSRLLLRTAHSLGGDHDAVMDRYAYILDWLQRDDYARLRAYVPDGRCRFSTWLVVVSRRLCLDQRRRRYGEASTASDPGAVERRATRRRLVDLVGEQIDVADLSGPSIEGPDWGIRSLELGKALEEALAAVEPRDRLLLKLRFEFDVPMKEIADIVRAPSVFHLYRRLRRVLDGLREALARQGIKDSVP